MTSPETKAETSDSTGILLPAFIGLIALDFFIYGTSLTFGFLVNSDDQVYIFRNPYLQDLSIDNLVALFTHTHYFGYLPMTLASFSLDYTLWEFHPFGFHLTQIVLHALNSFLALLVLLLARVPWKIALGTAFIYSAHPIHVESVVWVASRKNLLSSFFIFLSLICYLRHVQKPALGNYLTALCLFALALLSKPTAVVLPFIFVLYDLCVARRGLRLTEKIPFFAGSFLMAGATFLIPSAGHRIVGYAGGDFSLTALHMIRAYWDYVSSLAFPFFLSPLYYYTRSTLWEWQSLASYILIPSVVVLSVARCRSQPLLTFFAGWFFFWLLPVSNIVPLPTFRQDRYLYLPSLVVALIFANILLSRFQKVLHGWLMLSVVVLFFAGLANRHSNTFSSDRAMWTHVAETYPKWSDAQFEAGYRCWVAKDFNRAAGYYRRAIETNPKNVQALGNLGALLIDQGDYPQAKFFLEQAIGENPDIAITWHNLAVIAMKTGKDQDKIPQWLKKSEELKAREKKKDYNLGPFRYQ